MFPVEPLRHLPGGLCQAHPVISLHDIAYLLPCRLHILLLTLLHNARSEARGGTEAGVKVKFMYPVPVVGQGAAAGIEKKPPGERVPPSVKRGGDDRVRIVRNRTAAIPDAGYACGCVERPGRFAALCIVVGQVDPPGHALDKPVGMGVAGPLIILLNLVVIVYFALRTAGPGFFERYAQRATQLQHPSKELRLICFGGVIFYIW